MEIMGWTIVVWFLGLSVCDCWPLPEAVMHGEVHSPLYPGPYPPNLQERWDLRVPEGHRIRLTFTHLDIEASADCYYDSLSVLHGEKLLGKFCGSENAADGHHPGTLPILAPGNSLTLLFQTDGDNPERHQNVGFSAQYQAVDIDECSAAGPADGSGPLCSQICLNTLGSYLCSCHHGYELRSDQRSCVLSCSGGLFDEPEGHLSSPGYPAPPPHAVSCQYVIAVESGFTVSLNFTDHFRIESVGAEEGPQCLHHWLEVVIPEKTPEKLCGVESPGLKHTNSNVVRLNYHTDDAGQSGGWSLDYYTQRVKCPFPDHVAHGRVTPRLTEYLYRDYIYVRCDQGYKLMTDGQEIASFATMCQNNGQWHLKLPECHLIDCGEPRPLLNGGVTVLSGQHNQYLSIIQYRCNEPFYHLLGGANATFTCEADRIWRSGDDDVSPTCLPVCGLPTKRIPSTQRIIGGSHAPADTIPWQALLSVHGGRGGGIVIADRWIMTAAHVLMKSGQRVSSDSVKIHMGLNEVSKDLDPYGLPSSLHIHPDYNNPRLVDFNNDIALIKLREPITFSSSIMPVCLPPDGATYETSRLGLVSGFGTTGTADRRMLTDKLNYLFLPLVAQETCNDSVTTLRRAGSEVPHLTDNMFCAGLTEGGRDSCQGDSGGPFTLTENGRFWVAGIVSWGADCGVRGRYGVYTKVSNYVKWIHTVMSEN